MTNEEIKQFAKDEVEFLAGRKEHTMTINQLAKLIEMSVQNLKNKGRLK